MWILKEGKYRKDGRDVTNALIGLFLNYKFGKTSFLLYHFGYSRFPVCTVTTELTLGHVYALTV